MNLSITLINSMATCQYVMTWGFEVGGMPVCHIHK